MTNNKQVPLKKGLWTGPDAEGKVFLLASQCRKCGELTFPKKEEGICRHCQHGAFDDVKLSRTGKIYTFSVVHVRPPEFYKGEVPYALARVELPDGIRIDSLVADCDFEKLKVNLDMELVIDRLYTDESGQDVMTYKFKPVGM
jgi:hypothetical protein